MRFCGGVVVNGVILRLCVAILQTPTDVFPNIIIPVVGVELNYTGLSPQDMQNRLTTPFERGASTTVTDIEHIESTSYHNIAVVKMFFQPSVQLEGAIAQVTSAAQPAIRGMPPGTTPPGVFAFNASSVPVLQISLSSKTLSEQQLQDLATNFIRTGLATIEGVAIPGPYGGKSRLITVDLDPQKLQQRGISGSDIVTAINSQNLVIPQGTAKIGEREYDVALNSSPKSIPELNDLPVKVINGAMTYVRDVAFVHDGNSFQTNVARRDGQRGVLLVILKTGKTSTLDIVAKVRAALPKIAATLPPELEMTPVSDQSVFVRYQQ